MIVVQETVIKNFDEWNNIISSVTELVFDEGACNTINGDVYISNFPNLRSLTVKKNSIALLLN